MYTTIDDCFEGLIGLRGCTSTEAVQYLDKIGVHLGEFNTLVTSQYKNGRELFEDLVDIATDHVVNEIDIFYNKSYKTNSIIEGLRIGLLQDNNQTLTSNNIKGIEIELNSDSYIDFHLSEFTVYSDAVSLTISVWDLQLNRLIDSFTVTNETSFPHRTYYSKRKKLNLFIGYDATGTTFSKVLTTLKCCGAKYSNSFLKATGGEFTVAEDKIRNNMTQTADTGGISLVYSLNCNHREWLCTARNTLALPILYKTAALLMEYGINNSVNDRVNPMNTINKDALQKRMFAYGLQYDTIMKQILGNLKLPDDSRCFECKQNLKHAITIP